MLQSSESLLTLSGSRAGFNTVACTKDLVALYINALKPRVLRLQGILNQLTE